MADDYPDRPGYSFDPGPPPEASRFLKNKGLRPSFSWLDVEPEEYAVAFTAAKMTEIDLVMAAKAEVLKALNDGLPFAAFKKNWMERPALAEWLGKREYTDPLTGELVEIKRSPARRLKTIYNSNLRTARAAGQWERIERTKGALPYLEYRLGPSEQHRHAHVEKAGMILSVDSLFWDEWMPPNGWGCKCWVRQVTKREAERRGISTTPDVADTIWVNPRTGDKRIVPVGIDPGWERNPGKLRLEGMEALLKDKIEHLPAEVAQVGLRDIATSWAVSRIMDGVEGRAPVGILPAKLAAAADVGSPIIWVNHDSFAHLVTDKVDRPSDVAFRKALLATIANVHLSELAAVEVRPDGTKTLRVLIPYDPTLPLSQSLRGKSKEKPNALVLWFDDGMRVRTISPTTEQSFRSQAAKAGTRLLDLGKE